MKFKKICYLFLVLIFLTACKKDESHEIKFSTGEVYKFQDLSVEVIADEEDMTTREIFSSEGNEEKLGEIISLLENCKVVDQGYSYASIPGYNSLLINLHNKDEEDTIYMYNSERDRDTNKFHYSFYGKLGGQEGPALLSDDDLISEIKYIVDK
ncbi:hypothetical protein I6I93_04725 [Peptoniphilus harei]|uniref:Lipoprotein n=1 Tax=Peptoniphilus harei TaxID=54005 RepID=A0A2X1ZRG5_9FIRM|nr:hypothetical protein [Peptoniphilus harei]MDU1176076.1 hypothetical protein [Peptoniphilus harei]MDU5417477.1 hypothetical protein [Peptoniphilus harei]QQT90227.1 hypothetical protein I6I93_04725 [Peptoniphilus harei]SPY46955.1 Uncharacterised protein [Peptoniphilus harei]